MKVAAEHTEAVGKGARICVEERFLLDGIALHSGGVSPRNKEFATAVEADLADSWLSFRNGTAMPTRKTTDTIVPEVFDEIRIGFSDSLVEDVTQGGHWGTSATILAPDVG